MRDGLQLMRDAGLRLVTLTNSAPAAVQQQLANGLASFFERSFSVDTMRRFKPAAEAYRSVADALEVRIGQLRLVAAHAWDIVGGAKTVDMSTRVEIIERRRTRLSSLTNAWAHGRGTLKINF